VTDVPDPKYLPQINIHHFEHYLKKIAKRHKRHLKLNAASPKPPPHAELLHTFPNLRVPIPKYTDKSHFDINVIPSIFLQPGFDLSNVDTFNSVFTHLNESTGSSSSSASAKLLQEKLTHYLDTVEVQIAQQVSQKSDAFFHAMTSHDVLMDQLGQTIGIVKTLREKIQNIDKNLVANSLLILKNERVRGNYKILYRKLKVMSTVLQTQPTIQLLLSSPDYVGALDLIQTTEDLLKQDLAGIHSFRHLSCELTEMLKVINTLMSEEFERYTTADLNRPLSDSQTDLMEAEKLTCIVLGMLRRGSFEFVPTYQRECVAALKAAVKQAVIEVVSRKDYKEDLSIDEQLRVLPVEEWTNLLSNTTNALLRIMKRVKRGYEIMLHAARVSAGKNTADRGSEDVIVSESGDWQLSSDDYERVCDKLNALLAFVNRYSQERCSILLSRRSLNLPDDKIKEDLKLSSNSHWFAESASLTELKDLGNLIEEVSHEWEAICPISSQYSLKSAFNIQASRYMHKVHLESTKKLFRILDNEQWKQIELPRAFQDLVTGILDRGSFKLSQDDLTNQDSSSTETYLNVGNEKFAVVGTVYMLVNIIAKYCCHAEEIKVCGESLLRYLVDLLAQFNARSYQLMLGGGAVSEKTGLTRITSGHLTLLLRALQLILTLVPHIKLHFTGLLGELPRNDLDDVALKIKHHGEDIKVKLLDIMRNFIEAEFKSWEAKPPLPSKPIKSICGHMRKFHKAVSSILPHEQVKDLFTQFNDIFKEAFRSKLQKLNIVNNGGVQHGFVTSELLFYCEDLKEVKALPVECLELTAMNDIWQQKQPVR